MQTWSVKTGENGKLQLASLNAEENYAASGILKAR